jgi:putative nucleotidyltransferase with HDIG domain
MSATLSAGVAALPEHGRSAEALIRTADAAVYDAKLGGRNRVRVASDRPALPRDVPEAELADDLVDRVRRSYLSTITSLARTIEAKDPYTSGHTERVAKIATELAHELWFDEAAIRAVNVGAAIHDIGKIGVPDRVLLKPGRLDPTEAAEMRRHPEIASYIVAELDLPPIVKQIVRSHHERWDGGGYPDGLRGEEIPLAARVLAVADALDAMTTDRPYRAAMSWELAIAEVHTRSGTQFCPDVLEALDRWLAREHPSVTMAASA